MSGKWGLVVLLFLIITTFTAEIHGSKLRIFVNYRRGKERVLEKPPEITDGYWKMPVVDIPRAREREYYTAVIEGYDASSSYSDTVNLKGISVDRKSMLFPIKGQLNLVNKEKFPREFELYREGEDVPVARLDVPADGSMTYSFLTPGEYRLVDKRFHWNKIQINVLGTGKLMRFSEGSNSFEVTDISPGTYTFRIYYGARWIYQEDFIVVVSSNQALGYKIENGQVESVAAGAYTTTVGGARR